MNWLHRFNMKYNFGDVCLPKNRREIYLSKCGRLILIVLGAGWSNGHKLKPHNDLCVCVCVFTPPLPWDGGTA